MRHLMSKLFGTSGYDSDMFSDQFKQDFENKGFKNMRNYNDDMNMSRRYSNKPFEQETMHNRFSEKSGKEKEYCDIKMMEHVK